jgi:hypothetical protein
MNEQLLKDLVATAQKYKYDWNTVLPKFPEFKGYDAQLLKDYVATAEKYKYDYATVNSKFPEFKLKKKEPTASLSPSGQKPTSSVTPAKKASGQPVSSYEVKSESKLPDGSTQKIIRGDAGKGNKTYALRKLPNGREAWYEYSHSEGSMGLQEVDANGKIIGKPTPVKYDKPTSGAKDYFDKPITDPNRVSTLNRKFGYKASVKADEDIYTGFPEKENNEYRVAKLQNGQEVWEVRRKGQQDFTTISNKGSINALNNQFGKKVSASSDAELKRDAQIARQKSSSTDFKEVNKDLIGKEEDEVIKKLTSLYGNKGFTFRPYGLLTDWVIVEAKNGKTMKVSLDNTWSSSDSTEAINLRIFLSENQVLNDYIDKEREQAVGAEKKLVDLTQFDFNRQMSRLQGAGSQSEFENAWKEINATETATKTLMDKSQEAKDLRKAIIRSEFDTQQRISDLSGLTSNKLGKAELAAIAEANKNSYVERYMINDSYINDIAESRKDIELKAAKLRSDVDEFNAYAASNNLDPESPEAIEKKSALEAKYNDLIEKSNNIDSEIEGISLIKSQNEKNAALYFAYNETRGTVGGGLWNGALKGFFGLLGNENAEAMVDIFGSEFTTDEFIQSEDRSDLTKAAFSVSESLGALAAALVTGGTSAEGTLARKVGQQLPFFAMSYNEIKGEMDSKEFSDVPAWQKEGLAIMYGLGIGYLDKISSNFMIKGKIPNSIAKGLILRSIAGLEKGATAEAISAAIESNLKKDLAAGVLKVVAKQLVEGATEGTQSLAGSGLKAAFNSMTGQYEDENGEKVDRFNLNDWGKQALEEAYLGALGGAIMGVPTSLIKGAKNGFKRLSPVQMELNKKVIEDSNMRSMILTDIKTKLISGDITKEEAKEQLDAIKEASGLFAKMPDNLSPESTAKSFDLIVERSKIEKEISGKEDNLVVAQKERIKEINNELQTISKDAVQEQAAGEVSVQPETTTSEEVVQGKPKSGPEVVTEEGKKEELDAVNNRILKIEYANSKGELLEDSEPGELKRLKARKKELESASETDQVTTKSGPEVVTEEGKKEEIDAKQAEFDAIQIETIKKGEELQAQGLTNEEIESNPEFLSIRDRMDAAWTELDALKQPKETDTTETVQETPVTSGVVQEATQDQVTTLRAQEQVELAEAIPNIDEYKVDGEVDKNSMPADVLAKYNEIYDKYDKLITPLLTTAQEGTTVEQEVEAIGQLLSGTDQQIDQKAAKIANKKISKAVARAAKAISKIIPGTKFVVHDTDESYRAATKEKGKSQSSNGSFNPKTNTIHINGTKANRRTVAHEVFHAILINKVKTDANAAAITKRMVQAISAKIENNPALKKKLDDFISNYEENIQNEEKLSELVGMLAENYNSMSTSIKDLLARWIDKLANLFGLDPFDRNETYDMLNTIARKVAKGKVISEADVKMFKGGEKVNSPSEGLTSRKQYGNENVKVEVRYLEQEKMDELIKKGLVQEVDNLSSINGQRVVTTSPDDMLVGSIYVNGKEVATGNGGIFFVTKFGDVWANSNNTVTKNLAAAINESSKANGGKAYLVLVKGSDAKLVSSPQGVTSSLAVTESMLDAGLFSLSDFSDAIRSAVKDAGGNISLSENGSAKTLKNELDSFFSDVTASTFEKRGNVLRSIIANLAKSKSALGNKAEIIKFLNGDITKGLGVGVTEKSQSLVDLIANVSAEQLTKGLNVGDIYGVIEIDGEVKVFQDKHQSYPYHIKMVDKDGNVSSKKPILILPKNRKSGREILTSIDGQTSEELGSGFSGKVGATSNLPYGKGIMQDSSTPSQIKNEVTAIEDSMTDRKQRSKSINDIVKITKDQGFSDAAIREYLKQQGFSDKQATDAINEYNVKKEGIFVRKDGGIPTKIVDSIRSFRRRMFSARAFLAKSIFSEKENKDAFIAMHLNIVDQNVKDFNRLYARYKGTKLEKEKLVEDFDAYIRGDKDVKLPEDFMAVANSMRNQIDGLSMQLISSGLVDAEMAQTIKDNLGQYLTRSYKIYDRANWKKEVENEVKQKAINLLKSQYREMAQEISNKEGIPLDEVLNNLVNNRLDEMLTTEGANNFITGSKLGSKDLSVLKERQDIPIEIRMLLGEYSDPALNYAKTVLKLSSLAANHKFLTEIKKTGMGVYFFEKNDPRRPADFNTMIAAEGSESMNPLNGLYTTKEIADAFMAQPSELGKVWKTFMKFQSSVRWLKTIGSVATHIKNVFGNLGFIWINAHVDPKEVGKAFMTVKNDFSKGTNQQRRDKMNNYISLGIVKQSAGLGEIMDMFKDADWDTAMASRLSNQKLGLIGKAKRIFMQKKKWLEDIYQAEDDFFKIVAYEHELSRYSKAMFDKNKSELTEEELTEVNKVVTEIVKNTYPTYDRIPEAVKMVRRAPFIGNFVSFQAESYRTAFNTIALAKDELASDNNKIKTIGALRIAGATTYLSAKSAWLASFSMAAGTGLTGLVGYLFDDEDEEQKDKDIRKFVAPWSKKSDLLIRSAGNGKIKYIDFSSSDPHGGMKKVMNAFFLGETTIDGFSEGIAETFAPFIGEDMTVEALLALKNNKDKYGNPIYNTEESLYDQSEKVLSYMYKLVEPGTFSSIRRGWEAEDKTNELVANITGFRTYDVDINKQFGYAMKDYSARIKNAKNIYNSAYYNEKTTPSEKEKAYKKAQESLNVIYSEITDLYNSAERLGCNPKDLGITMDDFGNMSKRTVRDIKSGTLPELKKKD